MGDTSSISSSTAAFLGRQADNVNKAKAVTSSTFAHILSQTQIAVGLKPKTGFSSGATYEATTVAGQTKAAYDGVVNATKSALHIK
jgi:hypothetical protein